MLHYPKTPLNEVPDFPNNELFIHQRDELLTRVVKSEQSSLNYHLEALKQLVLYLQENNFNSFINKIGLKIHQDSAFSKAMDSKFHELSGNEILLLMEVILSNLYLSKNAFIRNIDEFDSDFSLFSLVEFETYADGSSKEVLTYDLGLLEIKGGLNLFDQEYALLLNGHDYDHKHGWIFILQLLCDYRSNFRASCKLLQSNLGIKKIRGSVIDAKSSTLIYGFFRIQSEGNVAYYLKELSARCYEKNAEFCLAGEAVKPKERIRLLSIIVNCLIDAGVHFLYLQGALPYLVIDLTQGKKSAQATLVSGLEKAYGLKLDSAQDAFS